MAERVGIGYDIHRLERGRKLVLGGVYIEFPRGLVGHSDADVLSHAIIDAVLGAAGLGDMGQHFPNIDDLEKVYSVFLLKQATALVREKGFIVGNVDVTVIAEEPKIEESSRKKIISELSGAMGIEEEQVNIKFKTNEGLGEIGRGEAIAAVAVAGLEMGKE